MEENPCVSVFAFLSASEYRNYVVNIRDYWVFRTSSILRYSKERNKRAKFNHWTRDWG
jgi:hypothetical protein